MFSREDLASFINRSFEPVWQTVRPVPLVHLDFGNGNRVTRTLHGNIATYVCTAGGQVLDVLPGIYTPAVYLERLNQFRLLANYVDQEGIQKREPRLRAYHAGQAAALKNKQPPPVLMNGDMGKRAIEGRLKAVLVPGPSLPAAPASGNTVETAPLGVPEDLAGWKALTEDTVFNETVRRGQIHALLAGQSLVGPEALTKRLYREVLHADLDDPYLGLRDLLFAEYPFSDRSH